MSRRLRESRRPNCAFVFHANGERIGDFRKAWRNAFVAGPAWEDSRRSPKAEPPKKFIVASWCMVAAEAQSEA